MQKMEPAPPRPLPAISHLVPASLDHNVVSGFREPFLGPASSEPLLEPTVPFPAVLLDQAMPRLTDTEWRLLCVVVRQTLGWQDKETGGRKQKDWLTQVQLTARTGRTAKPVAQAVSSLTAKQLIQVVSDQGDTLLTPQQRRRHPGRHWFQLHPQWNNAWEAGAVEKKNAAPSSDAHREASPDGVSPHEYGETPPEKSLHEKSPHGGDQQGEMRQERGEMRRSSTLLSEACGIFTVEKLHTTKQTDYKYNSKNKHNSKNKYGRDRDFLHSAPARGPQKRPLPERNEESTAAMQREGGSRSLPEEKALTIYGTSNSEARAAWNQEAAGRRWRWHKDIAKWISCEAGKESEKSL